MAISRELFADYVRKFRFRELFNDMGWNNDRTTQPIIVNGQTFILEGVAEKSGFRVLVCAADSQNEIPNYSLRKKIETKVAKLFQEHLIIFDDGQRKEQIWQLTVRRISKPIRITETRYNISQEPELLYERASGLFFELDEEDKITIVDVTKRVAENFQVNAEKVTKQFYEKFKSEYNDFSKLIKGIEDSEEKRNWYASLMLDRLMFCYFIQKEGFLDNNKNYLRDKLNECEQNRGKDKFYSFYRDFLLVLFHEGLSMGTHSEELQREIGRVPYLNGGLFDLHEIEKTYTNIQIKDDAFKRIFDFFDQYEWHLDTRTTSSGKEINPDVLGYIFEKYINDRASMGAYYTKEDITEYISKNTIIPYLFDEAKKNYPEAFSENSFVWTWLKESGDRYIYDSVKYGTPGNKDVFSDLSEEIKIGLDTNKPNLLERRKNWNKQAPSEVALPTEIWREVIERRKHYQEIKTKIENGGITKIEDFITYNLDIRSFAQDIIENIEDPKFVMEFYKALSSITVLDPTCGSGAFLFAALNILEDLYEACLMRMSNFVQESQKGKFVYFENVLNFAQSPRHPNLRYFIYKSIILRNLYGVDIMNEAVEIAKLRSFLKLVSTVDPDYKKPNLGLEPLPDIDFNIRIGNTLIGFVSEEDVKNAIPGNLDFDGTFKRIQEDLDIVNKASERYKEIQLIYGDDAEEFQKFKVELNNRLKVLNKKLNVFLHSQYYPHIEDDYKWLNDYKPFHWLAEFYEIIKEKGGFDVIIGNPPYVEYSKVRGRYQIKDYKTESCGNLYAFVVERSLNIMKKTGYLSFIVPLSIFSTPNMLSIQNLIKNTAHKCWVSYYSNRPDQLFDAAQNFLLVFNLTGVEINNSFDLYTTKLLRWTTSERESLFKGINYVIIDTLYKMPSYSFPKFSNPIENSIAEKLFKEQSGLNKYCGPDKKLADKYITYCYGGVYWTKARNFDYKVTKNGLPTISTADRIVYIYPENINTEIIVAILNSSLHYWFWQNFSDCRNKTYTVMLNFPIKLEKIEKVILKNLTNLSKKLMREYLDNAADKEKKTKEGTIKYKEFYPRKSKQIIDQIDRELAQYYELTEEELNFIINYDIKFRMGDEIGDHEA
jgi:hypothetical protein